jgi:osmotically-inducible protein OsmY
LTGSTSTSFEKRNVEDLTKGVPGVKQVAMNCTWKINGKGMNDPRI